MITDSAAVGLTKIAENLINNRTFPKDMWLTMTVLNFLPLSPKQRFIPSNTEQKKVTMFGLLFFILFTPGVSEFICTSSDLDMSYTFCDSIAHAFTFNLTPCSTMNRYVWKAALTWIPRSDIHFLKIVFKVWYDGARSLTWKELLCSGADDKYSVCGTLKGGQLQYYCARILWWFWE